MEAIHIDVLGLPALSTKKGVAGWGDCSSRHIDLQVQAGKFPKPIRIGTSPRWRRSDLLAWLESQAEEVVDEDGE